MARIDGEIVINRPVEEVFDFVADERAAIQPTHAPRREDLARADRPWNPPAEFSSFRRPVATIEFTGFERPRRLASSAHMSAMECPEA